MNEQNQLALMQVQSLQLIILEVAKALGEDPTSVPGNTTLREATLYCMGKVVGSTETETPSNPAPDPDVFFHEMAQHAEV